MKMIMYKDLIKMAHQLGLHTKGLTYSQILKHVQNEKIKVMNNWDVIEGNLRAVKDYDHKDMWNLYIKSTNSGWVPIQWLSTGRIQEFFNTKLPQEQ